jgi:hypothetical protein
MVRREFISRWTRILLLGGMAGATGYLTLSGKVSNQSQCANVNSCKNCKYLRTCQTPNPDNTRAKGDLKSVPEFKTFGGGGSVRDK